MQIVKAVIGGVLLFLGQELDFVFAAAMAVLIGFRLTPNLPSQWPAYYSYIFIGILAVIAAAVPIINKRVGYVFSGFLAGGYMLVEYYEPGVLTLPWVTFVIGGIVGALFVGLLTQWALIVVSALIGTYYVVNFFALAPTPKILVSAGLFIIGALAQVVIMRMTKED